LRLIGQKAIQERYMAVLQHAVVVVHARKLVPCADQEGIVQACATPKPSQSVWQEVHASP
jgi:hypothetical protein